MRAQIQRQSLNLLQRAAIGGVLLYRVTVGRVLGGQCRFHPTCSQYAIDAVKAHGTWRGTIMAVKRIAKCHPWNPGGYDPAD